jgi:hypothetical protein
MEKNKSHNDHKMLRVIDNELAEVERRLNELTAQRRFLIMRLADAGEL